MKRKIAAILAADVVGYSKLVVEDEEETLRRLVTYLSACDELVVSHEGRIVNTAGDAILAEFPSSVEAVRCAVQIQETVRARNLAYPPSRAMMVRIGINVGDIVQREDGELLGDAVNVAARLEHVAPSGTICVSRSVYEQVEKKVSVSFKDIGPQQLKNIADPIHAYVIYPFQDEAAAGKNSIRPWFGGHWRIRAAAAAALTIVVISVVVGKQLTSRQAPDGVAPGAGPTATVAAIPASPIELFDEMRLRELAAKQSIMLPQSLKILAPSASTPPQVTEYLGAWGGENRWNSGGRQAMLVVESVDGAGTALGVYAHGPPPNPNNPNRRPAQFVAFVGTITDEGLNFTWGQGKYRFKVAPDGSMAGLWDAAAPQGRLNLMITLNRVR